MVNRRTFLSSAVGSVAASSLFSEAGIVAAPKDLILDHLARETVRVHTRGHEKGYALRASDLAVTAANLRLMAQHAGLGSVQSAVAGKSLAALTADPDPAKIQQLMKEHLGYRGTADDVQQMLLHAKVAPAVKTTVATAVKNGEFPAMLWEAAEVLDRTVENLERPLKRPVAFREDRQFGLPPGPEITNATFYRFNDPCGTMFLIEGALIVGAAITGMTPGGQAVSGILWGTTAFFYVVTAFGCGT